MKRPPFLAAAAQALRDRLDKPLEQFQAFFLALFSDKDYAKVLDSIAKVDKALRVATPAATTSTRPASPQAKYPMVCHFCSLPGHTAPYCYTKRAQTRRGCFSPYSRGGRGKGHVNNLILVISYTLIRSWVPRFDICTFSRYITPRLLQ